MKEQQAKTTKKDNLSKGGNGLKKSNTGLKVKLFYDPRDIEHQDYNADLGDPGRYPFTRGGFRFLIYNFLNYIFILN